MDTINLIAIDPGSNTGVSIFTLTVPDYEIINIDTFFIDLSYFELDNGYESLKNKLLGLERSIIGIIDFYQPHLLAIEDTFVNYRFPKSAIYLSQYISTIELTVMRNNRLIKILKYPPKFIKKHFTGSGSADKDTMYVSAKDNTEITKFIDIDSITEHQIDSLAIGHLAITELRSDPLLLITI